MGNHTRANDTKYTSDFEIQGEKQFSIWRARFFFSVVLLKIWQFFPLKLKENSPLYTIFVPKTKKIQLFLIKKQKKTVAKKNHFIDLFFLFVILWWYKNGNYFLKKHIFPRFLQKKKFTKYSGNSQQKKPLLWMYTLNTN